MKVCSYILLRFINGGSEWNIQGSGINGEMFIIIFHPREMMISNFYFLAELI